jgi:hypothetical protein
MTLLLLLSLIAVLFLVLWAILYVGARKTMPKPPLLRLNERLFL